MFVFLFLFSFLLILDLPFSRNTGGPLFGVIHLYSGDNSNQEAIFLTTEKKLIYSVFVALERNLHERNGIFSLKIVPGMEFLLNKIC